MKVKIFDRMLASLLAIATIAAVVVFAAVALNIITINELVAYAVSFTSDMLVTKLFYAIVAFIALLIAIRVLIGMAGTNEPETKKTPTSIQLSNNENGSTFVSVAAIDAMAQKHCRGISKIKDCYTNVIPEEKGVRIAVKVVLSSETNIPELTKGLQKSLKEYVEGLSGVNVTDVSILVISASNAQKA